jgi:zinc protease
MHELRAIHDTMPAAELNKTKRYLQLQLPGEFETTSDIASDLVPLVLYGLPDDFYTTYQLRVGAVTQADVQRVAQRYIDTGRLTIVVVGDRRSIEGPLRATGVGPVEPRGPNGETIQQ